MRSLRTENDDQPGPMGRRQSSTGGDADQFVLMRTPRMMPSRCGPRNPGHAAGGSSLAGAGASSDGFGDSLELEAGAFAIGAAAGASGVEGAGVAGSGTLTRGGAGSGSGFGSSLPIASRRSSGVGVQRQ